jgi:DNA polymerase-1
MVSHRYADARGYENVQGSFRMKMQPLFGTQSRFTTPDKANVILVYDSLNLFFSVVLSKFLAPLATQDGRPSSQVFGTFNRIRGHVKKYTKPGERVALMIALDNEPREKKALLPEYKMNRDENQVLREEEKTERMESYYDFLRTFPCTFVDAEYEEADDVIASLTQKYRKRIYVMSSDKDLWQLLANLRVQQISLRQSEKVTDADLLKQFDTTRKRAHMIALYKAVMGDKSDNIPKVPRIPTKAFHEAMRAISYNENCEDPVTLVMEAAAALENPRAHALLVEHEKRVRRNLQIVTLKKDLVMREVFHPGNQAQMETILEHFECYSILAGSNHEFLFR